MGIKRTEYEASNDLRSREQELEDLNDTESYRRLNKVRRRSIKKLKVNREQVDRARDPKKYVTLGKLKSFQCESGVLGMAFNPFVDQKARDCILTLSKL